MRLYRIHGTQQWRLLVDALAEMGHESLTETEGFFLEEKTIIYVFLKKNEKHQWFCCRNPCVSKLQNQGTHGM